jgi:hypothetical protein
MSIHADKIALDRLVLSKQLYQQALVQSTSHHHLVSRMMSVINFDLAVETTLKLIVSVLDPHNRPKDERTFPQYTDKADQLMIDNSLSPLPDKRNITRVHDIRNDAQHNAKYPSSSEVSDCRTYVRDFLHQVIVQVWGLPFSKISLSDLVQHAQPKRSLVAAEIALSKEDYEEACGWAVAAVEWTLNRVGATIVGESEDNNYWGEFLVESSGSSNKRTGQKAYRTFWKRQETLRTIALGLNYADYVQYKETVLDVGVIVFFPMCGDEPKIEHVSSRSVTRESCR